MLKIYLKTLMIKNLIIAYNLTYLLNKNKINEVLVA